MSVLVPPAQLIGSEVEVPCADGHPRRYVNLDYAASTPVLAAVWDMVEAFVPWYSSVHRGTGAKSQVSTAAYEHARDVVADFVGAEGEGVIFVRNTTEAVNVLATALPPRTKVLSTPVEHHANMLPWRRHDLHMLPFTTSADELLTLTEGALRETAIELLAVTGASNVTGEVWPLAELADAGPRARRAALRRRRPARPAPRDRHDARAGSTTSRSPATSSTRPSARARSSAALHWTATRSCTAAARSSSSRSTTSCGPTRPTASRPAHPT